MAAVLAAVLVVVAFAGAVFVGVAAVALGAVALAAGVLAAVALALLAVDFEAVALLPLAVLFVALTGLAAAAALGDGPDAAAAAAAAASARAVLLRAARALPAAVWAPLALTDLPAAIRALAALAEADLLVCLVTWADVWTCAPARAALTFLVRRDFRRAAAFGWIAQPWPRGPGPRARRSARWPDQHPRRGWPPGSVPWRQRSSPRYGGDQGLRDAALPDGLV